MLVYDVDLDESKIGSTCLKHCPVHGLHCVQVRSLPVSNASFRSLLGVPRPTVTM